MSDLPTLTVDGDPADYITEDYYEDGAQVVPVRDTVRVDDLPTVTETWPTGDDGAFVRPLRVDDRVTLATKEWETIGYNSTHRAQRLVERPIATATVTRTIGHGTGYFVTVSDVEPIHQGEPT